MEKLKQKQSPYGITGKGGRMSDVIDRQAASEAIEELIKARLGWLTDARSERKGLTAAICVIGNLPSVDAVEVVRCKDCKYAIFGECTHKLGLLVANDENYCSYGERKDG